MTDRERIESVLKAMTIEEKCAMVKTLAKDLDVVTEKPMTTNADDALRVCEAEKKSKGKVVCTFNYRY